MSLGDAFPIEQKINFIERELTPFKILRLLCKFPNLQRYKYLLLASVNKNDVYFFIINSNLTDYIKNNQYLYDCCVHLKSNINNFLTHDSFLNCNHIYSFLKSFIIEQLKNDFSIILGAIHSIEVKQQIIKAVRSATTLERGKKSHIISAMEASI